MAVKSVLRKVSKLCPQSSDIDSVFRDLEDDTDFDQQQEEPKKRTTAADKVKSAVQEEAPEIIEATFTEHVEEISEEELPI